MRSMHRAAAEVAGLDLTLVVPDGKTDPAILREGFRAAGIAPARWRELEEEIWLRYPRYLEEELARPRKGRRLKPGVRELLRALAGAPGVYLGLLTGNLEAAARLKLEAFGLNPLFPVGAFGSDCADRCRLAQVALERARRYYGVPFRPERTWVVGDTPFDVEAARAIGARALAVATGRHSLPRLQECLPDAACEDLSPTSRVLALLLGERRDGGRA